MGSNILKNKIVKTFTCLASENQPHKNDDDVVKIVNKSATKIFQKQEKIGKQLCCHSQPAAATTNMRVRQLEIGGHKNDRIFLRCQLRNLVKDPITVSRAGERKKKFTTVDFFCLLFQRICGLVVTTQWSSSGFFQKSPKSAI